MIDHAKKTIVFDFGNVLINLDFERCFRNFENVLKVDWSDRKLPESIISAIKKYDRGLISDEALIWAFQNQNPESNPRDIINAWNSLIGEMPRHRFDMLESLAHEFNLCILSNINSFHINYISDYFQEKYQLTDFEDRFFNQVFYSHEIGKRKPDNEIYDHVTDVLQTEPNQLLFIDDMKENILAARSIGWNAIVHHPKKDITKEIDTYLKEVGFK